MQREKSLYPLVSIIIPAYNMANYIRETIDSIRAINYPHWEAIIIDDGSADETFTVASSYCKGDERFTVKRQENKGVSAARNLAIMLSHGVYILPLDADDLLDEAFISHAVEVMESRADVVVVRANGAFFEGREGIWRFGPFSLGRLALENQLSNTSLFRAAHYAQLAHPQPSGYRGLYDELIPAREDWDFWISMLKGGGEVHHLDEVGFRYRVRSGSRRFTDRRKKREVVAFLNLKHADFLERELLGPLYTQRSHSKKINLVRNLLTKRTAHPKREEYAPLSYWLRALPRLYDHYQQAPFSVEGKRVRMERLGWRLRSKDLPTVLDKQQTNATIIGFCRELRIGLFERYTILYHA